MGHLDPMFYSELPREDMGIEPYMPMRGVIFGILFSLPFAVVIGVAVYLIRSSK